MSALGKSGGDDGVGLAPSEIPVRVFINYRRDDTDAAALLLYERLADSFGPENVFLDVKSIEPGMKWLEEIKSQGARGTAFLALIGRSWLEILKERQHDPEDYVSLELEFALARWPGRVIPVLVGGARMPAAVNLPRPIRALAGRDAVELRHVSFDQDVEQLFAKLVETPPTHDQGNEAPERVAQRVVSESSTISRPNHAHSESSTVSRPGDDHYGTVLEYMVEEGTVVPVLGSRVWGALPDTDQLAAKLVSAFKLDSKSHDLAEVAQHVVVAKGPSSLYRAIKEALRLEAEPNDVHRFLAGFPERLEKLRLPPRYQMIVTTNYDTALEHAFDAAGEPYDLAVFVASKNDKGRFLHVPWRGEPQVITEASKYRDFPIDPFDELERTVIVKIHGAAAGGEGDHQWDRSYVLTEDQYIDYLVTDQIGSVVPLQILNKLTSSHCLFLGYAIRDWSLRVFLKRIWHGNPLDDKSWAIESDPDALEKDFWNALHVELLSARLGDYANELDARLTSWPSGDG